MAIDTTPVHISGTNVMNLLRRIAAQPETLGDGDCEALHAGLLGQPVNTVTSLGYVAGGAWLLTCRSMERRQRTAATAYAVSLALGGAGSVAYHGPQFAGAQLFHDLPIVAMVGIGATVPLARALRGVPVIVDRGRRPAVAAATLALTAGLSYLGGRTGSPGCRPRSVMQLHGLWHLGTAAAATLWAVALWPAGEPAPPGGGAGDGISAIGSGAP